MREITLKYSGDCRACGATLPEGASAVYERRVGVFCPECAPTDPEEIRRYRQEAADRKADKLEGWAEKRREDAGETLQHITDTYRGDFAFNTQPGHIPDRARVIWREDKAFESLQKAGEMQDKAKRLRHVRVAGDAERALEAKREAIRPTLKVGMLVTTPWYGTGHIKRINKKTATLEDCGVSGTFTPRVDIAWLGLKQPKEVQ